MPPTFTIGQWTQWGSGTYAEACWKSDGSARDVNGNLIGVGRSVGDYLGLSSGNGAGNFVAWSPGGVWDTARNRFVAGWGGGDQAWVNFDVNEFDVATGTWNPDGRPLDSYSALGAQFVGSNWPANKAIGGIHLQCPACFVDVNNEYPNGATVDSVIGKRLYPNWGHNWGALHFMPSNGRLFLGPYAGMHYQPGPCSPGVFEWDPATKKFSIDIVGSDINLSPTFDPLAFSAWDSTRNRSLWGTQQGNGTGIVGAYNPAAALGSRITRFSTVTCDLGASSYPTAVYDSRRDRLWVFGIFPQLGNAFGYYDFTSGANTPTLHAFAVSGSWPWQSSVGILYDPVADRIIMYTGGQALYSLHPDTLVGSTMVVGGANPGTLPQGGAFVASVWNRFAYLPDYDVYAYIYSNTSQGMYAFAPVRNASTLAFTDLSQAPRSGNTDTSKGQTPGVNGAVVSVFGQHLGGGQGTSTLTIGGVNVPTIYYWGPAIPPQCPATLTNQYQNLQMITFQIPSTCPTGLQNIIATVNGTASTPVAITVTTAGTIYFAATGGGGSGTFSSPFSSIQAGINAMVSGDILYVRDGLNATSIDTTTLAPSTMTSIVAYPGASCQLGDATHDPIASGFGGFTQNRTFAKFTILGSGTAGGQAATIGDGSRVVGCKFSAPSGNGSSGTLGVFGSNVAVFGCEFTNCGTGPPADDQYHVLYRYGRRLQPSALAELGCEIAHCYFHDNNAARAINCFNANQGTPGNYDNPIGDHHIHHNVIVNQQWAGIGQQAGVIGTNNVHDNLLINCGQSTGSGTGQSVGIQVNASYTNGVTPSSPIVINIYNNTLLNSGDIISGDRGAFEFANAPLYTLILKNNLISQPNGIQYISTNSTLPSTTDAVHRSHNLWFGSGAPPTFDSSTVNQDPRLQSIATPYNLHLRNISPAIGAGQNLSLTSYDFDGVLRPLTGGSAWDIGAYQFAGGGPTPPAGTIAISYDGKLRDRVGQGTTALAPDGAMDGTISVQLSSPGGKTITSVRVDAYDLNGQSIGIWDTDASSPYWVCAVSTGLDSSYLNNGSTMNVNFALDDGSTFRVFCSDASNIEFLAGNSLTVTIGCSDGTSASQTITLGSAGGGGGTSPPSPSNQFNFQTVFMYGQGA